MQFDDLVTLASRPRINRYLHASLNDQTLATKAYFLNIDISGNIFKAISFLEISLRNKINIVAPIVLDTKSTQWLFEVASGRVSSSKDFKETRNKIKQAIAISKDGTHDQVVCQLSFGFWCSIFSGFNYLILGSRVLKHLKPSSKVNPDGLRSRLHAIRTIRNRIAHQEPVIFNKKGQFSTEQLKLLLKHIYWVQKYLYSHKLSQIAFYEQIKQDIIRLEKLEKKRKPSGVK